MTTIRSLLSLLFLFLVFTVPAASLAENGQVIEQTAKGVINWTEGSVSSSGSAEPATETGPVTGKAPEKPDEAATRKALANLSETIRKIRINSEFTVGEYISNSNELIAQIENMVAGAPVTRKQYLSDGTIQVSVKLAFSGGFSQLLLPAEIRQIEPVKTIGAAPTPRPEESPHTGLVVDAAGLGMTPSLSPRIFDESGREVYGPLFASREYAVHKGVATFARNLAAAGKSERPGRNPLVVKGLRRQGLNGTIIVISNSDASKIRSDSRHLGFLNQCKVVLVVE